MLLKKMAVTLSFFFLLKLFAADDIETIKKEITTYMDSIEILKNDRYNLTQKQSASQFIIYFLEKIKNANIQYNDSVLKQQPFYNKSDKIKIPVPGNGLPDRIVLEVLLSNTDVTADKKNMKQFLQEESKKDKTEVSVVSKKEIEKNLKEKAKTELLLQNNTQEKKENEKTDSKVAREKEDKIQKSVASYVESKQKKTDVLGETGQKESVKNTLNEKIRDLAKYYKDTDIIQFLLIPFEPVRNENNVVIPGVKQIPEDFGLRLFKKAFDLYVNKNTNAAVDLFLRLIDGNFRIIESYYYVSWCYYVQKDYEKSIFYMRQAAVTADSTPGIDEKFSSEYYAQLASFYYEQELYQKAIEYYEKSLEKYHNNLKSYNGLGLSYYHMQETKMALSWWGRGKDLEIAKNIKNKNCTKNYNWLKQKLDTEEKAN